MWKDGHRYINERGQVILAMYWEKDNESHKKQRVVEGQRQKKATRRGEEKAGVENNQEVIVVESSITAEEIKKQNELIIKQQEDIKGLQKLLVNLTKIVQNQTNETTIIYQNVPEETKTEDDFPILNDLDVKIISTDGFETSGEVGEEKKEGSSILDKSDRLKKLMAKKELD